MALITLFFFAHQPDRLRSPEDRRARSFQPGDPHGYYFDDRLNREVFLKVAEKCYFPATRMLLELAEKSLEYEKPFRAALGISGILLDQAERYAPALLDLLRALHATGSIEFTGETYYHSLAGLFDVERREFKEQARMHSERLQSLFGTSPRVFRNTECLYNDGIAASVRELGFEGIITEGVDWLMRGAGRSTDLVYTAPSGLPVLLRNYRLSDDVGYRFSNKRWEQFPLSADTFAGWLAANTDMNILLALDYEAIGEHMWEETGIFEFLRHLPDAVRRHPQLSFATPTEAVRVLPPAGTIRVDDYRTISWADQERDTSAWLGNEMQRLCFDELKSLEEPVKSAGDPLLTDCWRRMLTSDHLYYMATKSQSDADVHRYFSAYGSPHAAFARTYSAILDLRMRAGIP